MCNEIHPVIRVQAEDFDTGLEIAQIVKGRRNIGATVSFTGYCRDEGGRLSALELEHYEGMAQAEMKRIAAEAIRRWQLTGLTAIHRHGRILPGEQIVLVITASQHRKAAFEAASFMMDYLKTQAPFWKKEHLADGSSGQWVEARDADETAVGRWRT